MHQPKEVSIDLFKSFGYGLKLDVSILGYLLIATVVLGIWKWKPLIVFSKWLFAFLLFAHASIALIDVGLYKEWGHTINYQFFEYMRFPAKALGNLTGSKGIWLLLLMLLHLGLAYYFGVRKHPVWRKSTWSYGLQALASLACLGIGVLFARGGLQVVAINQSFAFFSKQSTYNYAAINGTWNFVFTLFSSQDEYDAAIYEVVPDAELNKKYSQFFSPSISTPVITKNPNANVVIVMLESFSANLVGYTGASRDATPRLNQIANEGISFTQAYASGNRTDKGVVAVNSGFPAQANASILTIPSKAKKLPSLIQVFKRRGYATQFYYGGEPEFANKKAYLLNAGIDNMYVLDDYPNSTYKGKWGVPDEITLKQLAKDIKTAKSPFFKLALTLSSHEPFDYPNSPNGLSSKMAFETSVRYTDSCLGVFWNEVKETPNTLFVFIADHGRHTDAGELDKVPWVTKIPVVIAGAALADSFKGLRITHEINQHHLPSNVLAMLGFDDVKEPFLFQQSWFNDQVPVYFTFYNGVGLLKDSVSEIYYNDRGTFEEVTFGASKDSMAYKARVYQQKVMKAFSGF